MAAKRTYVIYYVDSSGEERFVTTVKARSAEEAVGIAYQQFPEQDAPLHAQTLAESLGLDPVD